MARFRDARARQGPEFQSIVAVEILRTRLMLEADEGSASLRLAAAPFANYDTKPKIERLSEPVIEQLANQIETRGRADN